MLLLNILEASSTSKAPVNSHFSGLITQATGARHTGRLVPQRIFKPPGLSERGVPMGVFLVFSL